MKRGIHLLRTNLTGSNTDFACLLRSYLGTAVGSYRPMIELREAAVLKK